MRITRTGLTALKGGRHLGLPAVELTLAGPVGDRAFCLVDRDRRRVLRTVENPALVRTVAHWARGVLTVEVAGTTYEGVPQPTGEELKADYWGRTAALEVLDGPWGAAYTGLLGRRVVLARPVTPGEVVYGASVTLVTTGSLDLLAERLGEPVDGRRFRSTFVVSHDRPHVEDDWVGSLLRVGEAVVEVRGAVPRCAVVDLDPETGAREVRVLDALAGYRLDRGEIGFGVDAVVTAPGRVRTGDPVTLGRG